MLLLDKIFIQSFTIPPKIFNQLFFYLPAIFFLFLCISMWKDFKCYKAQRSANNKLVFSRGNSSLLRRRFFLMKIDFGPMNGKKVLLEAFSLPLCFPRKFRLILVIFLVVTKKNIQKFIVLIYFLKKFDCLIIKKKILRTLKY